MNPIACREEAWLRVVAAAIRLSIEEGSRNERWDADAQAVHELECLEEGGTGGRISLRPYLTQPDGLGGVPGARTDGPKGYGAEGKAKMTVEGKEGVEKGKGEEAAWQDQLSR